MKKSMFLVAAMAGTDVYNQFAVQGLRINEIRALIDDDYSGDAYTEDVLSQISESTGMSVKFLGNKLQADIADSDVMIRFIHNTPLGRLCEFNDIGNLVEFLASDQSSYITGQSLNLTGGACMD